MGYFRRPVRRSKARDEKSALIEATCGVDCAEWSECDEGLVVGRESFLRFMIELPGSKGIGLFRGSDVLEGEEDLPAAAMSVLRSTIRWFNTHLPVPRRLPKTAVCWFRADAAEMIQRLRDLIEVYRLAGASVFMKATSSPGRIVYHDDFQVAAIPHRDRRSTRSVV